MVSKSFEKLVWLAELWLLPNRSKSCSLESTSKSEAWSRMVFTQYESKLRCQGCLNVSVILSPGVASLSRLDSKLGKVSVKLIRLPFHWAHKLPSPDNLINFGSTPVELPVMRCCRAVEGLIRLRPDGQYVTRTGVVK
jgi:hypothetical protein